MKTTLQKDLLTMQDLEYREFHLKIINETRYEVIGVRIPLLREYAKKLLKEERTPVFKDEYYEEVLVHGLYIAGYRCPYEEKVRMVDGYLGLIDCWGICDSFTASLKFINKNRDAYYEEINRYLYSKDEFIQRFGFVCLLNYYVTEDYYGRLCDAVKNVSYQGYYDRMASAWLLSYMFMKFYDETLDFIKKEKLDDFVVKKGIQKALDSYRINSEQKDRLRAVKAFL